MNLDRMGSLAFRFRGGVWTLFFLLVLFLSRPGTAGPLYGLVPVALGQGIRFSAACTLRQYRGEEVGAAGLVTWGPYSLARNPLYLGNALIGAGWCVLSGSVAAFIIFSAVFAFLYLMLVIPYEESFLRKNFPVDFARYSERVGRFFPLKAPSLAELRGPFDRDVLWRSERHSLWVTLAGTLLILSRRWW
jgi:protein-S-isoprenylcysteine O-methyltransferase Ste14